MTEEEGVEDAVVKLCEEFTAKMAEYVDSVRIFVSRQSQWDSDDTFNYSFGAGNWFSQIGQIKDWIVTMDAKRVKDQDDNS